MAKSKSKRKKKAPSGESAGHVSWGATKPDKGTQRINIVLAVVAVAAAIAGGVYWYMTSQAEHAFLALAKEGRGTLGAVETRRDQGGGHIQPGEVVNYPEQFPTSGRHHPIPTDPGFYERPQRPMQLVHGLEHGHVVIYYDRPGAAALDTLRDWTGLYGGHWDGVIATPMTGLGEAVVLNAWNKHLRLEAFDPTAAAAFVDAYRGRGPENPVR